MMKSVVTAIILASWTCGLAFGQILSPEEVQEQLGPLNDGEFSLALDPATAKKVDDAIETLGSPKYQEREDATSALIEIGAPAFTKLRDAYQRTDELEVRLRIEDAVRASYLNHHVLDRNGFLGISLQPYTPTDREMNRIPEGTVGVRLTQVIPNTGAAAAGLQADDVIVGLNGEALAGEGVKSVELFSEAIRKHRPGTQMKLEIIRGIEHLTIEAVTGRCPEKVIKAGNVRAISAFHDEVSARFEVWWGKYFRRAESAAGSAPE